MRTERFSMSSTDGVLVPRESIMQRFYQGAEPCFKVVIGKINKDLILSRYGSGFILSLIGTRLANKMHASTSDIINGVYSSIEQSSILILDSHETFVDSTFSLRVVDSFLRSFAWMAGTDNLFTSGLGTSHLFR